MLSVAGRLVTQHAEYPPARIINAKAFEKFPPRMSTCTRKIIHKPENARGRCVAYVSNSDQSTCVRYEY